APLLGVQLGDTFEIRASGPTDQSTSVASAVVDLLLPTAAAAKLSDPVAGSAIATGARAFRTVAAADALPVTLPSARDPFLDRLAHGLV
ncbi:hypothetical protein, partial [Paenibacillus larvae]|uniref:hypothetical protein n=1 Tax=Paenibacillus larvae TaxID=1464 RepID=UPI0039FC60DA